MIVIVLIDQPMTVNLSICNDSTWHWCL